MSFTTTTTITGPAGCCCPGAACPCVLCTRVDCMLKVTVSRTGCLGVLVAGTGPDPWDPSVGTFAVFGNFGLNETNTTATQYHAEITCGASGIVPNQYLTVVRFTNAVVAPVDCQRNPATLSPLSVATGAVVCDAGGFVSQQFVFTFGSAGTITFTVLQGP